MKPKTNWLGATLAILLLLDSVPAAGESSRVIETLSEIHLPGYQIHALEKDLPVRSLLMATPDSVWMLGRTSLWNWRVSQQRLLRLRLVNTRGEGELRHLTTDGLSLYAASDDILYQVQFKPKRLLRYRVPLIGGESVGFAGRGDNILWVHTQGVYKIDRYGKSLIPKFKHSPLKPSDQMVLDDEGHELWYLKKRHVYRVDLDEQPPKVKRVFRSKHDLIDIRLQGDVMVTATRNTVLRLSHSGTLRQAIPVEEGRQLADFDLTPRLHVYLFDDGLLEVFDLKAQKTIRLMIPDEDARMVERLVVSGSRLALIVNGRPRLFQLPESLRLAADH